MSHMAPHFGTPTRLYTSLRSLVACSFDSTRTPDSNSHTRRKFLPWVSDHLVGRYGPFGLSIRDSMMFSPTVAS